MVPAGRTGERVAASCRCVGRIVRFGVFVQEAAAAPVQLVAHENAHS
jgi:hypothetical protein